MAFDGYFKFGTTEISNIERTTAYAESMGLEHVFASSADYAWMLTALGSAAYTNPLNDVAPWYDPDFPISADFGGVIVMTAEGLEDSSRTSTPTEYTGDGGNPGRLRNATKTVVFTAALVGKSEAACEYGLRWLKSVLKNPDCTGTSVFCNGQDMTYWRARYQTGTLNSTTWIAANQIHLRNVTVNRGPQVTSEQVGSCSALFMVTWTAVAGDPYEYGVATQVLAGLGVNVNPYVGSLSGVTGSTTFVEAQCPETVWDPIYDPLFPAAAAPPTLPDFYPDGWVLISGSTWDRDYAEVPASLIPLFDRVAPIITLKSPSDDARMLRVRFYPLASAVNDVCSLLWECIVSYMPEGYQFIIDGVQQAVYVWDGVSGNVRRAESLAFGTNASPITWPSFSCGGGLRVTIEQMTGSDEIPNVGLDLSLTPKGE